MGILRSPRLRSPLMERKLFWRTQRIRRQLHRLLALSNSGLVPHWQARWRSRSTTSPCPQLVASSRKQPARLLSSASPPFTTWCNMGRYKIEDIARFYQGKHIAIIGNGPSIIQTNSDGKRVGKVDVEQLLKQLGCPEALPWTINGGWYYHPTSTLGFQMDDVKGPAMAVHPNPDWYVSLVGQAQIP